MKNSLRILLLLCSAFISVPALAEDPDASISQIAWADAPSYIQKQAKTVVMHCSNGEYTANQVRIFQYDNSTTKQQNYILDFSAMKGLTQQLPGCNYNSPVCGPQGCFLMAYTEINNNMWDQSWFGSALKLKFIEIEQNGKSFPAAEVMQSAESCTIVNGGKEPCPMHFTWKDKKFKYYGYAKMDVIEAGSDGTPAQSAVMPIIPATPDEPGAPPAPVEQPASAAPAPDNSVAPPAETKPAGQKPTDDL